MSLLVSRIDGTPEKAPLQGPEKVSARKGVKLRKGELRKGGLGLEKVSLRKGVARKGVARKGALEKVR